MQAKTRDKITFWFWGAFPNDDPYVWGRKSWKKRFDMIWEAPQIVVGHWVSMTHAFFKAMVSGSNLSNTKAP